MLQVRAAEGLLQLCTRSTPCPTRDMGSQRQHPIIQELGQA